MGNSALTFRSWTSRFWTEHNGVFRQSGVQGSPSGTGEDMSEGTGAEVLTERLMAAIKYCSQETDVSIADINTALDIVKMEILTLVKRTAEEDEEHG